MSLTPWKKLSSEIKFQNRWWTYRLDKCVMPNGKEGEYNVIDVANAVCIIPQSPDGRFLMVQQFRYPHMKESLEFPKGNCRHGEIIDEPLVAAERELQEEGGYTGDLKKIGEFAPWNTAVNEISEVYFANNLRKSQREADESEEFIIEYFTQEEIKEKIRSGEIWDGMSIAAWYLYLNR